jgi:competence protein ComEA
MIEKILLVTLFALFIFAVGKMVIEPHRDSAVNSYSVHNDMQILSTSASRSVEVFGAVASSGVQVIYDDDTRVIDVLEKAGGLLNISDVSQLDLAMIITPQSLPGMVIYVPFKNDIPDSAIPFYRPTKEFVASGKGEVLNINVATVDELIAVTGIPTKVAQNIVKYRDEKGKIKSFDEIRKIEGTNPEIIYRLKTKTKIQ